MNKFKVGDTVRCVDAPSHPFLEVGSLYCIKNVRDDFVKLTGCTREFFKDRFELAEEEYPNPTHKHRDLIIAWANGAKIQIPGIGGKWLECRNPDWTAKHYRIMPAKTEQELQLEKLEKQAKEIQSSIEALKNSMK